MKTFMKVLGVIFWIVGFICSILCLTDNSDLGELVMFFFDIEPMMVTLVILLLFFLMGLPFFCIGVVCGRQEELEEYILSLNLQRPGHTAASATPVRPHNPDPTVNANSYGNTGTHSNSAPLPDPYTNPYATPNPRTYSPDAVEAARNAGRTPQERKEENEMAALNRQFKQKH